MRLVRALVTDENREPIIEVLQEKNIDFVTSGAGNSAGSSLVEFPVPADGLGDVLDATREAGLNDEYVVILNAENAVTPHTEDLQERYATDFDPLRPPELRSKARNLSQDPASYAAMIFLSAVIAALGLLVDSPAILVLCQSSIEGYSRFSLIRASSVVNRQSMSLSSLFRSFFHAATS